MNETDLNMDLVDFELNLKHLFTSVDQFFLLSMGMIIMFMQCGFAFLELGSVRSKNVTNILIKNMVDVFTSGIAFWVLGYAFAFGEPSNAFIGYGYFASSGLDESRLAHFFFQYVFACTSATIVSGAMCERCEFISYIIYSIFISGFTYPVVVHWVWADGGWLRQGTTHLAIDGTYYDVSFKDFAGSGVVHVVGGTAALLGCWRLGPRIGRFGDGKNAEFTLRGHSVPMVALGGFILIFGFIAFIGGSQGNITAPDSGRIMALSIVNAIISAAVSAMVTLFWNRMFSRTNKWSLISTLNAFLTGLVAVNAGADVLYPWGAAAVGLISAFVYKFFAMILIRVKIDDPVNAIAVHLGGGIWGVLAVAIFGYPNGVVFNGDFASGLYMGWQVFGLCVIILWVGIQSFCLFTLLHKFNLLRVSLKDELTGLDIPLHDEPGFPVESYGHGWMEEMGKKLIESGEIPLSKEMFDRDIDTDDEMDDDDWKTDKEEKGIRRRRYNYVDEDEEEETRLD